MTVYFFDCFDGRTHHTDAFGADLRTDAEASEQADVLVHALLGESLERGSPETAWVQVRSGDGRAVYSVQLNLSRHRADGVRPMLAGPEERSA